MSLLKIERKNLSKMDIVNTNRGATGSQIKRDYAPDIMINGALYDMLTHTNIVFLEDENILDGFLFANEGIGITKEGDILWSSYEEAKANKDIKDYLSGAPILVKEGKIGLTWGNKISSQIQGKHLRSAIGFNANEVILYCSDDKITLTTLAERMLSYGCKYAINLDGGGSQYLCDGETVYKSSTRSNKTWILLYKNTQDIVCDKNSTTISSMSEKVVDNAMFKYKITAKTGLNIRSQASMQGSILGTYKTGDIVEILTIKDNWGKTDRGWISMSYAVPVTATTSTSTKAKTTVIRDIGYLHPEVQKLCKKLLQKCAEEGLNVGVFETYRCNERQQYLYEQGNTTIKTTGAHGFCVAFDIVVKDSKGNWTWDTSNKEVKNTYYRVGEIGKSLGLEWGGSWTSFVDLPHFQYLGGISLTKYRNGQKPSWWNGWVIGTLQEIEEKKEELKQEEIKINIDEPSDWATKACEKAMINKLIKGDGSGYYGWHDTLTLERFIVILDKLGLVDKYKE